MGMFLDSVAFYWPKDKTREELAPKLESFFEGYGLKLRMKDPTRESYAVYDEDQSCSDVMPELIAALSEVAGYETIDGGRRRCPHRHYPCSPAFRAVRLRQNGGNCPCKAFSTR